MLTRRSALAAGLSALAAPARGAEPYSAVLTRLYGAPIAPIVFSDLLPALVERTRRRADGLLRDRGLAQGSVGERLRTLWRDERYLYADDDAGRDRAVADMNRRLARLRPRLAVAFGDLPIPRAQVRRMAPADAAAGRGGYRQPGKDGAPGAYYVDLARIRQRPSWTLPSVAFHEVTPGHLMQIPLQQPGREAGAFFEAWATYAEELAAELGAYDGDPLGELGYLHWRLFRLGRARVDAGLAGDWSRDRAVATLADLQGFPAAFISIEADVARMAANPGKVAVEAIGAMNLADWRPNDRAQWPAYHRMVLTEAPWTLADLDQRMYPLKHPRKP